jgi:hypothetical protein
MRVLNFKEVENVSGAFSCTFVNVPTNWGAVGLATLGGAARGGGLAGAILWGGGAYLSQKWDCRS